MLIIGWVFFVIAAVCGIAAIVFEDRRRNREVDQILQDYYDECDKMKLRM